MENIQRNKKLQLILGLVFGIIFGFLLQKGGVTTYEVIINQLRLVDFTVLKIMLSAVVVTMLSISILFPLKIVKLHPKSGSIRNSIIGGLLFGIGFGTLGYCPGTVAGAVGSGNIDGLIGGVVGIIIGSGIFASFYTKLIKRRIVVIDKYSNHTFFNAMKRHPLFYTVPFALVMIIFMYFLESLGL